MIGMEWMSQLMEKIDVLCHRYEHVISRLQSKTEEDDEERWLVKESTKTFIADMDNQAAPMTKQAVWMLRALHTRVKTLIGQCERVFPQLGELGDLKAIHNEINSLLNTPTSKSLTQCPLRRRFGGYKMVAEAGGETENVFLYVAEKIGIPGGTMGIREKASTGSGSPLQIDTDIGVEHRTGRNRRKMKKSKSDVNMVAKRKDDPDTETIRTPTAHTDPAYQETDEQRADLLWKDFDEDEDDDNSVIRGKKSSCHRRRRKHSVRRKSREKKKKERKRYRSASQVQSPCFTSALPKIDHQETIQPKEPTPIETNVGTCKAAMDGAPKEAPRETSAGSPKVTTVGAPKDAGPVEPAPPPLPSSPDETPIDWIGAKRSAKGGSGGVAQKSQASSRDVQTEERDSAGLSPWMIFLFVLLITNVVIQLGRFLFNAMSSSDTNFGLSVWPTYCKVANNLCRAGYEFACTDYCASRLDRYMWGRK